MTRVGIGHLAFGLAFVAIGAAWLLRSAGLELDAAWLAAVTAFALGAAGLSTALWHLVR